MRSYRFSYENSREIVIMKVQFQTSQKKHFDQNVFLSFRVTTFVEFRIQFMNSSKRKFSKKKKRITTNVLIQNAITTKFQKRVKIISLTKKNELHLIQLCLKYSKFFDETKQNK